MPAKRAVLLAAVLSAPVASLACVSPQRQLVSQTGAHRLRAHDPRTGLTIIVTTEAFDGEGAGSFTTVHMLVANMGHEPIRLAPGDFELRDERGFRYDLYDTGSSFAVVPDADAAPATAAPYDPGRDADFVSFRAPEDLARSALPWGALQPGTQMRGFVYFEDVTRTANHPTLRWHAHSADQRHIGEFAFELHVAS